MILGFHHGIAVTDFLVWELITITDTDFVLPEIFSSQFIVGLPLPTLFFSELITVRITVTDTGFNFMEGAFHYTR